MAFILRLTGSIALISCSPVLISALTLTSWPKTTLPTCHSNQFGSQCFSVEERGSAIATVREILNELILVPQCGDRLWYRITHLNMNDFTQDCPSNWREISSPVRTCGRPTSSGPSCPGVFFSTGSVQYSRVCGRAIGFQNGSTDSFRRFGQQAALHSMNVDTYYVDGLSVTHGGVPRTHIWTFAVGATDAHVENPYLTNCPCAYRNASSVPGFVGDNYFCESGNREAGLRPHTNFFEHDPVWDGEQCERDCCGNGKSPPWFSVTLPSPTTDNIEVRICGDEGTDNEDTPVQLLEIYIQ